MNKVSVFCLTTLLSVSSFYSIANETKKEVTPPTTEKTMPIKPLKDIAPYPEASKDQARYAIYLPQKENEQDYRLELIVGKNMMTDSCNRYLLGGKIEEKELQGWGYSYYVAESTGQAASTLMACNDDKKQEKFVSFTTETLTRYNSKLPVVIYVPKDMTVKYRIWSAPEEMTAAEVH